MIAQLSGKVISKFATSLVIECAGIGFFVNVPITFAQTVKTGSTITIYIQPIFSQKGLELFGFGSQQEKEIFNIITSVRGIGARAGISILSRLTPDEINQGIDQNRIELFKTIPGIGQKKAEAIIFNLRKSQSDLAKVGDSHKEIIQVLCNLGFSRKEALAKLSQVKDLKDKSIAQIIQLILKDKKQ